MSNNTIRNIAIIAHVDHGKTTLVDAMLQHLVDQGNRPEANAGGEVGAGRPEAEPTPDVAHLGPDGRHPLSIALRGASVEGRARRSPCPNR